MPKPSCRNVVKRCKRCRVIISAMDDDVRGSVECRTCGDEFCELCASFTCTLFGECERCDFERYFDELGSIAQCAKCGGDINTRDPENVGGCLECDSLFHPTCGGGFKRGVCPECQEQKKKEEYVLW